LQVTTPPALALPKVIRKHGSISDVKYISNDICRLRQYRVSLRRRDAST